MSASHFSLLQPSWTGARALAATCLTGLCVLGAGQALAQAGSGSSNPSAPAHPAQPAEPESAGARMQRIVVEDAGSRVEESRVGGVTRQIAVQPKTGAPAYQIQPAQVQGPATSASERTGQPGGTGRSSWRVLSF